MRIRMRIHRHVFFMEAVPFFLVYAEGVDCFIIVFYKP